MNVRLMKSVSAIKHCWRKVGELNLGTGVEMGDRVDDL